MLRKNRQSSKTNLETPDWRRSDGGSNPPFRILGEINMPYASKSYEIQLLEVKTKEDDDIEKVNKQSIVVSKEMFDAIDSLLSVYSAENKKNIPRMAVVNEKRKTQ